MRNVLIDQKLALVKDQDARDAAADWIAFNEQVLAVLHPDPSMYCVVSKTAKGEYYSLITVFKLGDKWTVSADAQCNTADYVFAALQRRMS
jgi:hypothetical protein